MGLRLPISKLRVVGHSFIQQIPRACPVLGIAVCPSWAGTSSDVTLPHVRAPGMPTHTHTTEPRAATRFCRVTSGRLLLSWILPGSPPLAGRQPFPVSPWGILFEAAEASPQRLPGCLPMPWTGQACPEVPSSRPLLPQPATPGHSSPVHGRERPHVPPLLAWLSLAALPERSLERARSWGFW